MKRMKDYKSKLACFDIEEKEIQLNLRCERKFVAVVYAYQSDIPYNTELLENQSDTPYESIADQITIDLLTKYKDKIYKDEFRAFVRVRSERCIAGERINFSNVPAKNKETLINRCVQDKNVPVKGRLMSERPPVPVLLEPELFEASD